MGYKLVIYSSRIFQTNPTIPNSNCSRQSTRSLSSQWRLDSSIERPPKNRSEFLTLFLAMFFSTWLHVFLLNHALYVIFEVQGNLLWFTWVVSCN